MSAQRLRAAAAAMRARAEAVEIPWHPYSDDTLPERSTAADFMHDMQGYLGGSWGDHAGSWHPAVAVAVADWLDGVAGRVEAKVAHGGSESVVWSHERHAIAVADAYLPPDP